MRNRELSQSQRPARWSALAAAFGAILLGGLLSAAPAQADSAFERGFENELGRILAHETVHLGKHVLFHGASPYAVQTVWVDYYPSVYAPRPHVHWPPRVAYRHARHHRHERDCRH